MNQPRVDTRSKRRTYKCILTLISFALARVSRQSSFALDQLVQRSGQSGIAVGKLNGPVGQLAMSIGKEKGGIFV